MNALLINNLMDNGFSPTSKLWIYTSDKSFDKTDELQIQNDLDNFCSHWDSHGILLNAKGFILLSRIIVLVVDDANNSISGCSMDKSVAFLKNLENKYKISLFNRLLQTGFFDGQWQTFSTDIWADKLKANEISLNSLFIDTLVSNLQDFQNNGVKKLGEFWLKRLI